MSQPYYVLHFVSTGDIYTLVLPIFCSRHKSSRFASQNSPFQDIFASMLVMNSILKYARLFHMYIGSFAQKLDLFHWSSLGLSLQKSWKDHSGNLPDTICRREDNPLPSKSDEILIICNIADYQLQPSHSESLTYCTISGKPV